MLEPRAQPYFYGHEGIERQMLGAWRQGRFPHSLLFLGPRGVGKATFAYRLARFLLAQPRQETTLLNALSIPDNHSLFSRIASGGHGDIMVVEPEEEAVEIGVQNIRAAVRFLSHTSIEGGWRIVVIDGNINRNAANALLKILEEPPEKSLLILINESTQRLPATIHSRCRRFTFLPLSLDIVERCLKQHYPDLSQSDIQQLASLSEGRPGHAMHLYRAGGSALYHELLRVLALLPSSRSASEIISFCQRMSAKPTIEVDPLSILGQFIALWLCKLIWTLTNSPNPPGIPPPTEEEMKVIHRLAPLHTLEQWTKVWETANQIFQQASRFHLDRFQVLLQLFNTISGLGKSR